MVIPGAYWDLPAALSTPELGRGYFQTSSSFPYDLDAKSKLSTMATDLPRNLNFKVFVTLSGHTETRDSKHRGEFWPVTALFM